MSKRFVLCFSISLGSWNEKYNWHSLTVPILFVRNSFIKNLLTTKSSTFKSAFFSDKLKAKIISPYSKIGLHAAIAEQLLLYSNSADAAKYGINSAMKSTCRFFRGNIYIFIHSYSFIRGWHIYTMERLKAFRVEKFTLDWQYSLCLIPTSSTHGSQ